MELRDIPDGTAVEGTISLGEAEIPVAGVVTHTDQGVWIDSMDDSGVGARMWVRTEPIPRDPDLAGFAAWAEGEDSR